MSAIETQVYQFSELSDAAKERARDWYRESDDFYPEMEPYETAAKLLGITYNRCTRDKKTDIRWSGFCSQGDGASFSGSYSFAPNGAYDVRNEFPKDTALHSIADALVVFQCRMILVHNERDWTADIGINAHSDRFVYGRSMFTTISNADGEMDEKLSGELTAMMRSFALWIYKRLEAEYEYQMSDECVTENIEANEYEFDEEGNRA